MADIQLTPFHDWLVGLRRDFHQYPELAYREEKTAARIAEVLAGLGVPVRTGVGHTGVVASLNARKAGPTLALRADMDALPLEEINDVPYKSKHSGIMHACGHDGHVTIILGVVRWLLEHNWTETGSGRILFLFQPAEEGGAGAKAMLDSRMFDGEPVAAIFAGHMHPELPVGHIGIAPETSNAASDSIRIQLQGKGGHGAHPHLCNDPIVAGASLIMQLQSIVSRNVSPFDSAVLSIGCFHAGTAPNIIPQEAVLTGTLRTLRPAVRESVLARLEDLVRGLERSFQIAAACEISSGYPVLVNDVKIVDYALQQARSVLGDGRVHLELPRMGAEDFAFFLQQWPGAMIRLGCHDPGRGYEYGLHSPSFDFDERTLDVGVRLFAGLLTEFPENAAPEG